MSKQIPEFAFLGCTNFSKSLLLHLIESQCIPAVIFTIPEEFNISYSNDRVKNSNFANLHGIASEYSIPIYEVESKADMRLEDYQEVLSKKEILLYTNNEGSSWVEVNHQSDYKVDYFHSFTMSVVRGIGSRELDDDYTNEETYLYKQV